MNKVKRVTFVILCLVVSSFSVEEIIIEATKIPTPLSLVNSSVEVLTEQDLLDSGSQFLPDALATLPGVYVSQSGGPGMVSSVYLRGAGPRYTLILLDGVKLNDSQDINGYDLSSFDIANIERVEIIKGAQSSLYGADAMAGVINIISKKGSSKPSGKLNFEKGSYGSSRVGFNLIEGTESLYFNLGGSLYENDGFSATKTDPDKDSFLSKNVNFNSGGKAFSDIEWSLNTRIISADGDFDSGTYEKNQFISSSSIRRNFLDDKLTSEIKSSYRWYKLFYPSYSWRSKTESLDLGWNNVLKVNDNISILTGIEKSREDFGTNYNLVVNGYFLASQIIVNDELNFSLSRRRDHHKVFDSADTFQGSFSLFVSKNTRLRGAVGTSYLAPNGDQITKNDNLEAERGKSLEVGIDRMFKDLNLDVDLTFFKNSFKQAIEYIPNTDSYTNFAKATVSGVEIGSSFYPSDISNFRLSYTYLDTDVEEDNIAFLNRKPSHKFNARYQLNPNNKLSITSFISIVDETTDIDYFSGSTPTVTLSDYTLASINTRYKINDHTEYYLNIMNVLDEEYETTSGYNIPEFSVYSGIRLNF